VSALVVLLEDQAPRTPKRRIDGLYDERRREHSRHGCVSMAPGYLCKLCRSYEAGRNLGLDLVRDLVAVNPVVRADSEHDRCLYCRAELKGDRAGPSDGHDSGCPWAAARLLLDARGQRSGGLVDPG